MKRACKAIGNGLALALVLPCFVLYRTASLILGRDRAFPGWSQAFSLIPGFVGGYLRAAFYQLALSHCEPEICLSFGTVFSHPTARVGKRVYVGLYCCLGDVTLEDDVLISSHVSITNGGAQHGIERLDVPIRDQKGKWPHVTIGEDSWIGERAVVMADVGRHCVIGAGSVVTKPIPDYAVAMGMPARVIYYRNSQGETDGYPSSPECLGETPASKSGHECTPASFHLA